MNCRVIGGNGLLFVETCHPLVISALIPFSYTFIRFLQDPRPQVHSNYLQTLSPFIILPVMSRTWNRPIQSPSTTNLLPTSRPSTSSNPPSRLPPSQKAPFTASSPSIQGGRSFTGHPVCTYHIFLHCCRADHTQSSLAEKV